MNNARNERTPTGDTPLIRATRRGHEQVVGLLLKKGAKPHIANDVGLSALTYAVREGHKAIIYLLVMHDAKHDYRTNDGDTPINYGCQG